MGAALNTLLAHVETSLDRRGTAASSRCGSSSPTPPTSCGRRWPRSTGTPSCPVVRRTTRPPFRRRWPRSRPRPTGWPPWSRTCCCSPASTRAGRSSASEVDVTLLLLESVADARVARPRPPWQLDLPDEPVTVHRRRAAAAPGRHQPARQRPPPHPARHDRDRRGRRRPTTAPSVTVHDDGPGLPAGPRRPRLRAVHPRRLLAHPRLRRRRPRPLPGRRDRPGPRRHRARSPPSRATPPSPSAAPLRRHPPGLRRHGPSVSAPSTLEASCPLLVQRTFPDGLEVPTNATGRAPSPGVGGDAPRRDGSSTEHRPQDDVLHLRRSHRSDQAAEHPARSADSASLRSQHPQIDHTQRRLPPRGAWTPRAPCRDRPDPPRPGPDAASRRRRHRPARRRGSGAGATGRPRLGAAGPARPAARPPRVLYLWGLGASGWANSFYSAAVQAGLGVLEGVLLRLQRRRQLDHRRQDPAGAVADGPLGAALRPLQLEHPGAPGADGRRHRRAAAPRRPAYDGLRRRRPARRRW